MPDDALADAALKANLFAKLQPEQKARVITALRSHGHVVGYLGDGINDGPALRAADIGISVDTAVDVARESADIILLEKSLGVLAEGVVEGRKVFENILKYIRMGASSNFGNMLSVLGASIFLPFLPMLPLQILTNNLLYDVSQAAIPTDNVDGEVLRAPRRWEVSNVFRFIVMIGPVSSIYDYATYGIPIWIFGAWTHPTLFQTGWFVESLLSQTLIIHTIRTARVPIFESMASTSLLLTTALVCIIGISIPYSSLASTLGFIPLPTVFWPIIAGLLLLYGITVQVVKVRFVRHWGL
jgi:Mg2+-importing ATPase